MKKKRLFNTFRIVFEGVKIPWLLLFVSLVCSVLMTNAMIKSAGITAQIIDSSGNIQTEDLVSYILFTLGGGLLAMVSTFVSNVSTEKINLGVRTKLWRKMLRLPLCSYDKESGETLVSRVTTDCNKASSYFGAIIMLISGLYGVYMAITSMYGLSPYLTIRCIILIPIVAVGTILAGKIVYKVTNALYLSRANTTTYLLERVKNFRLVRSSNMMEKESEEGNGYFKKMFGANIKYILGDQLMASFVTLTGAGILVITFILGSIMVASGKLTAGVVIAFYTIAMMGSVRISVLIVVYGMFVESDGVFKKISEVLVAEEESEEGYPLDLPDEDIYLKNVHFSYDNKQVLKGLNCVIPKKRITAVIGNNGAGKTTLFKLLCRMYEPSDGKVLFGTTPIDDFNLNSWRKAFAMVAQDRPLLSGTIRENITYGCDRQISDKELEQVAKQANIWSLIQSLPDGFGAQVGPNGSNFSGGQRQCIAIARAIMRNPDYLLLDEATSNLDAQSEKMVSMALENLMADRTTLIIGHSLSAIRCADNIIVLRDGVLDACGSPQEVFKASETYRDFVMSQCKLSTD